jgi:hypothetical protein
MDLVLFTPDKSDLYTTLLISGIVIVALTWLGVQTSRAKHADPRRRILLPMLAYFGGLLALMAFMGAFWATFKYPVIGIGPRQMTIDGESFPRPAPSSIRLEAVGKGVNVTDQVLLVQTRDRRNWAFPGDRYDVRRMYGMLREEKNGD